MTGAEVWARTDTQPGSKLPPSTYTIDLPSAAGAAGRIDASLSSPRGQRATRWLLLRAHQLIRNTNTAKGNVTG